MDWDLTRGSWKDSKPIGKQAEDFILENSQYVLYFRKDSTFHCPDHWDLASNSPRFLDIDCQQCYGFGVKTIAQIVPARLSYGPGSVSHRKTDQTTEPGYMEYFTTIAHFPRAIKPVLEDVVCVCEWNKHSQQLNKAARPKILSITSAYQIKTTNDYFERELAYYSCGLEIYDIQLAAINKNLQILTNLTVVDPKFSWPQNSFW